jgi:iron complex transport system substrate-binding protein
VKRRSILAGALAAGGLAAALPLPAAAQAPRIVSVGGAITEVIYALDGESLLVGVDSTSLYPEAAKALPQIGYMRAVSSEGVLALRPTLVISTTAGGPATSFEQIKAAGVQIIVLPDRYDYDSVVAKFEAVGKAIGREKEAEAWIARGRADMTELAGKLAKADGKPRVLLLLGMGGGAPQAAGTGTAAEGIIRLAGGINAIEGYHGYRPLTPEGVISSRPDFVVITHQTAQLLGSAKAVLDQQPALRETPAGRANRILVFDTALLLGFGPRTPQAARDLAQALHPALTR